MFVLRLCRQHPVAVSGLKLDIAGRGRGVARDPGGIWVPCHGCRLRRGHGCVESGRGDGWCFEHDGRRRPRDASREGARLQ